MKILLLSPGPPTVGGIATWTKNLLEYLSENSSDYEVIHQDTSFKYKEITEEDFFNRIFVGFFEFIKIYSDLKINLKKHKPDVIHLTSSPSLAFIKDYFLLRLARKYKIPVVTHWRFGVIPKLAGEHNWEWKLLGHLIRKSLLSIVIDSKSYDTLLNAGFNNVVYIPNPISQDVERMVVQETQITNHKKKGQIIYVGHVVREKGVFELVDACTQIPMVEELLLIGPFEQNTKKELLLLADRKDGGRWFKLLGALPKEKVLESMQDSLILTLPSYTEGFPNVIIESMAMGCSVIATDVGAIPEMLAISSDYPCGICIPPMNVEKLRDSIISLLKDTELAQEMAKNGTSRVLSNYTLDNVMKEYYSVWERAVAV
jgi:glycosyltransferase involved in cell wall biosynthesis